jgi:putative ABC transport system permease protein
LGGENVITSLSGARRLDPAAGPGGDVAYYIARLGDPDAAAAVSADLNKVGRHRNFEALTADAFAARTTRYWLTESGAGVAFIFGSVVAILVAVVITSQTLAAAVAASIKEYAALRALGFSMQALRTIVLAQSFWVGAVGVLAAGVLTLVLVLGAKALQAPIILSPAMIAMAGGLILLVSMGSGFVALRRVAQADPATLLL